MKDLTVEQLKIPPGKQIKHSHATDWICPTPLCIAPCKEDNWPNMLIITIACLFFIETLAERKQDTPQCESVLFHPVLKAYPTHHSWIITAHISLGDLNRQLCMFNHQKTLAYQLLVKLQDQPLASQLVINALLDKFSNIVNIYESYKPTIRSAVQLLKTDSENVSLPENLRSKRSLLPLLGDSLNGLQAWPSQEIHGKSNSVWTNWYRHWTANRRL